MVMQILEETAAQYGLAALLQEKPFNNVNGSGKHNNWSIGTASGINILNPKQLEEACGSKDMFPLVMAAIISAVDEHGANLFMEVKCTMSSGDLMRTAIAAPGNDFRYYSRLYSLEELLCTNRLGACEAPPAIVSTYLGDDITA